MEQISDDKKRFLRDERNFFAPILRILQDNGGIIDGKSELDRLMPQYTDLSAENINYSEVTPKGNNYVPYWFGRNFALKNLSLAGLITYGRNEPIKLTKAGADININSIDFDRDIYSKSLPYWSKKRAERKKQNAISHAERITKDQVNENDVINSDITLDDGDSRQAILKNVKSLDAYKFESFSRGLLTKIGFEFDDIRGIAKSGDGGIDGYGYIKDIQSLRTTRVAIQCKRYTDKPVGSPEIDGLRGAVNKYNAEYGIFITTSYYTDDAIRNSRYGGTPITLIDGNKLVDLMIQYNYHVEPVTTYIPDEDYFG